MADNDDIVQKIKVEVEDGNFESSFQRLKSSATEAFESIKDAFNGGDIDFDKVAVDGAKAFNEFKEAGTEAFEELKKAGSDTFDDLKEVGTKAFEFIKGAGGGIVGELSEAFSKIGISAKTAFIGVGVALAAVTVAVGFAVRSLITFVESQNNITNALGDLSDKTHTAIADVSALETAYAHAGVSAKEFADGYGHLSDVVGSTWDKIKKDTETGVDTLEQKSIAAAKAASALNKIEADRKQAPINNPTGPINPFQGDLVTAESTEKAISKELELRQARLAAREAERAENEARKNDLSQITKGVESLIDGNQTALKSFNATAENIVKGVVAAAGKGADTFDKLGESFASVGSKAPEVQDVLTKLAATLSKIEDPALRSKVALTALGSSGQSFLSAIDSGNLEKFTANLDKMNGRVTEADKKIAGDLKSALTGLSADLSTMGTSIASAFGPGLTDAIKKFDEFLTRRNQVKGLTESIAGGLGAAVSGIVGGFVKFAEVLGGTFDLIGKVSKALDDFKNNKGLKVLKEDAKDIYETVKAIDDTSSKDDEQSKRGIEKFAELRKKDLDAQKKQAEEEKKFKVEKEVKTPSQEEWDKLSEDDKHRFVNEHAAAVERQKQPDKDKPGAERPPREPEGVLEKGAAAVHSVLQEPISRTGTDLSNIGHAIEGFLSALDKGIQLITSKLQPETPTKLDQSNTGNLGIRGDNEDTATQATTKLATAADGAATAQDDVKRSSEGASPALDSVKTSAEEAAKALASVKAPDNNNDKSSNDSEPLAAADGGHIRGPGTATSDSIPAMLSDGEYVVKKSAVDQIGVAALDAINAGRVHFADGGAATIAALKKRLEELNGIDLTPKDLTPKDASGDVVGKAVDAAKAADKQNSGTDAGKGSGSGESGGDPDHYDAYVGGHANQAVLDSINAASEAAGEADPNFIPIIYHQGTGGTGGGSTKRKRHAEGGLIGDIANALNSIRLPRFAEGGSVSLAPNLPRFADKGMVSLAPRLPRFADGGAVGTDAGGGLAMQHLGSVDLSTNYGDVRVMTDRSGLGQLKRAAVQRNMGSTPKSSWAK